jgi:PAS domain S-box-containing protein
MDDASKSKEALIAELHALREQLAAGRAAEERWRALVDAAPNYITLTDLDGRIQFSNKAQTPEAHRTVFGTSMLNYVAPESHETVRETLRRVRETGKPQSYDITGVREQGEPAWYHTDVAPLRDNGELSGYMLIATDVTDLKRSEERLRDQEHFLARAQELAHVGCWEWEVGGRREVWSDELYRLYGVEPATFAPTFENFLTLVHPDDRARLQVLLQQAASEGHCLIAEYRLVRPDGQVRFMYAKAEMQQPENGRPARLMGASIDVTELKTAYEEIALRTAELQQAKELDRLKSNFVNAVTHELRTPLTAIRGYAEFLEDGVGGPLTPQQLTFVRELELGAQRLERLVDDLLDFARIEAGTFTLRVIDASLTDKIRETAGSLEPQTRAAGLKLALDLPDTPIEVPMDAQRIGQVLLNLIYNALKFTAPGGTITVRACPDGEVVRCEVSDTGIGIAPADQPRLFRRFSQLESGVRSGGGTGLGLSISKAIVETHGGAIGVESEPGRGSTFWFTLPREPREVPEERTIEAFEGLK